MNINASSTMARVFNQALESTQSKGKVTNENLAKLKKACNTNVGLSKSSQEYTNMKNCISQMKNILQNNGSKVLEKKLDNLNKIDNKLDLIHTDKKTDKKTVHSSDIVALQDRFENLKEGVERFKDGLSNKTTFSPGKREKNSLFNAQNTLRNDVKETQDNLYSSSYTHNSKKADSLEKLFSEVDKVCEKLDDAHKEVSNNRSHEDRMEKIKKETLSESRIQKKARQEDYNKHVSLGKEAEIYNGGK